jgi:hypothetical protein
MYGQARVLAKRDPEQAIQLAYEYFLKNQSLAADDLVAVFGKGALHG